jgi:hypothetical protein
MLMEMIVNLLTLFVALQIVIEVKNNRPGKR